jgi:hypothetical protein
MTGDGTERGRRLLLRVLVLLAAVAYLVAGIWYSTHWRCTEGSTACTWRPVETR